MKARKVIITIEAETDLPMHRLKDLDEWKSSCNPLLSEEVQQIHVQVVQAPKAAKKAKAKKG